MVWTRFMDMHSGGRQKLKWTHIFIEAPLHEAEIIFQNRFKRNPNRVTCTCCGDDYSSGEEEDLAQATGYDRNCRYAYKDKDGNIIPNKEAWLSGKGVTDKVAWKGYIEEVDPSKKQYKEDWAKYKTVEEYIKSKDVLVIYSKDIKPKERKGQLKQEGYVWVG